MTMKYACGLDALDVALLLTFCISENAGYTQLHLYP